MSDLAHDMISAGPAHRTKRQIGRTPAILKGLIFGPTGTAITPAHTRKGGRLYRYYISIDILRNGKSDCPIRRVSAAQVEDAVIAQIKAMVQAPEIIVATWRIARRTQKDITERQVHQQLQNFEALWNELFPIEQARRVQLLVERVRVLDRVRHHAPH